MLKENLNGTFMTSKVATYEKHSIDVVEVSVFPVAVMNAVLGHGDFGSIKDRGLDSRVSIDQ